MSNYLKTLHNITFGLLCLAVITLPFTLYLMLPIEVALLLVWIMEWNWKEKITHLKTNGLVKMLWIFLALSMVTLVGICYSQDVSSGFSDLDCKSWLWVAALIFFTSNATFFTDKKLSLIILSFIVSTFCMMVCCFCLSMHDYLIDNQIFHLSYKELSHFMHPSYCAMYVSVSLMFSALYFMRIKNILQNIHNKIINIFFGLNIIASIAFVFFLQSKAGTLILLLLLLILVVLIINHEKRRYIVTLLGVAILVLGSILLFKYSPFSKRLSIAWEQFDKYTEDEKLNTGGAMQRIAIWRATWDLAWQEFPFGTGSGDVNRGLLQEYEMADMKEGVQRHFNAHNQYLQTFAALGVLGIATLLTWLIVPFVLAAKKKDMIYMLFILICMLNMLVESMLEARSGVDFMAIFGSLLMLSLKRSGEDSPSTNLDLVQ